MAKMNQLGVHKTSVRIEESRSLDPVTIIRYWNTDIVRFCKLGIVLDTGGFFPVTTKRRMNQASNVYNLGYKVFQKNHHWYVEYGGMTHSFDGRKAFLLK